MRWMEAPRKTKNTNKKQKIMNEKSKTNNKEHG